jgi:hypothetical protein
MNFHVVLTAGLGNRLMGLSAAYNLSSYYQKKLIVHWPAGVDCNILLTELLEIGPDCNIEVANHAIKSYDTPKIVYTMFKENPTLPRDPSFSEGFIDSAKKFITIEPYDNIDIIDAEEDTDILFWVYNYFLCNDSPTALMDSLLGIYRMLNQSKLIPALESQLTSFLNMHPSIHESIVVHARRPYTHRTDPNDEIHSVDHLSDNEYVEIVSNILNSNPEKKIFFCSNCQPLEDLIVKMFKESIILFEKETSANDSNLGMINAFIEMLIISKAKFVYASSSFSTVAMSLSGRVGPSFVFFIGPGTAKDAIINKSFSTV